MLYILLRGRQGTVANIGSQSMEREARRDRNCQTPNSMDLFRNEYHEAGVSIPFHLEERAGRNPVESFVSPTFPSEPDGDTPCADPQRHNWESPLNLEQSRRERA